MGKIIICHGQENDYQYGIGDTIKKAFENYEENDGSDSLLECLFYEADQAEIEFTIKRKETATSATKK